MPRDTCRFKSRNERIHHALRMYHGIGCEEHSEEEIADFLNVRRCTVDEYVHESPQAEEIAQTKSAMAQQTRDEIIMDLRDRLRTLRELEEQLKEAVEVVVTGFDFEDAEMEAKGFPDKGVKIAEDETVSYVGEVPVPSEVKEVPQFNRLQAVWEEQRETQEQIVNLLGLEPADEHKVETSGEIEVKRYKLAGDDEDDDIGLPEASVKDLSEEDSV